MNLYEITDNIITFYLEHRSKFDDESFTLICNHALDKCCNKNINTLIKMLVDEYEFNYVKDVPKYYLNKE